MDELRTALELATDEELQHLTQLLFRRQFNPLDYWYTPQPSAIRSQKRDRQIQSLEARFRFLAADGVTVLRGQTSALTYRQVLFQVGEFLKIPCGTDLETTEIEAEIFLALTSRAWDKLPRAEQRLLIDKVRRSLAQTDLPEALPLQLQHNPLAIVLKGGSTLVLSSVLKSFLVRQIARQVALHFATGQALKTTTGRISTLMLTQTAIRYGVTRNVLGAVVPLLWGWFLADLGWRAIATNYGRIIPMIVTLAQIRLTREPFLAV
ncbi:hypothetical protein FLX56_20685 [Synechococcus moorigangaii CMS01]|nr:hypothetical protein [Synechococcus moorigangaii CMS01]